MIYHYTTLNSFKGMLHSPTLIEKEKAEVNNDMDFCQYLEFHASDARMMNDKKENEIINKLMLKQNDFTHFFNLGKWLKGFPYIISFCKQIDYMPMWKGYTGNDGICLGFCVDGKEEIKSKIKDINKEFVEFEFRDCEYLSASAINGKRRRNEKLLKTISETPEHQTNHNPIIKAIEQMIEDSIFCKLKEFEYEQETRLVAFAPNDFEIKEGRYGITIYKQVNIPLSLLKEIIISPFTTRADIIECEIIKLLKNTLFPDTISSEIPVKVELSKFA